MNVATEYEKMQLVKFRIAASMTAGEDTTLFSDLYQKHKSTHPLALHGDAVAYSLWRRWGGRICIGEITLDNRRITHAWNELPTGLIVDLVSDFFGGDGYAPFIEAKQHIRYKRPPKPLVRFYDRFLTNLFELEVEKMMEVLNERYKINE